jgi:hypothetical protein
MTSESRAHPGECDERRIAIVAVHGVADQQPGESVAAMAELLLSVEPPSAQGPPAPLEYSAFRAHTLLVPLRPAVVHDPESALTSAADYVDPQRGRWTRLWTRVRLSFSEQRGFTARMRYNPNPRALDDPGALAHEVMRQQLAGYQGGTEARSLRTTRLEGSATWRDGDPAPAQKDGPPPAKRATLHLYEVFWADISRFGGGAFAFFGALYQLLFHVGSLGRQALDDARLEHSDDWRWRWLSDFHAWAVRLIVLPIPILNLILLFTAFSALPARKISGHAAMVVALGAAALIAIVCAYVAPVARLSVARGPWRWMWVPLGFAVAAAGLVALVLWLGVSIEVVLALEWWLVGAGAVWWVLGKYQHFRPGARLLGYVLLGLTLVALIVFLVLASREHRGALATVEYGSLRTMHVLFAALRLSWIAVFVLAILAGGLGWWVRTRARSEGPARYARARAAVRTGRLALGLTVSLFMIVTIIIWCGVFAASVKYLDVFKCRVVTTTPLIHGLGKVLLVPTPQYMREWLGDPINSGFNVGCDPPLKDSEVTVYGYVRGLLVLSVSSGLPLMLVLLVAAFGLLIWMALPSVGMEGRDTAPSAGTNAQSKRWGAWLSRGLDSTSAVTVLLWTMSFVLPVLFAVADHLGHTEPWWGLVSMRGATIAMLSGFGAAVLAFAVTLIGVIGKVGGSGLDVALDVDNYLRNVPVDATPRARIAERYTSMLRTIAAERDEAGRPYDAVIIVAHSLGALISGDLLRFLKREAAAGARDPALTPLGYGPEATPKPIPIYLFTMGNPVRQLLDRFLGHRYRWVRPEPDNGRQSLDRLTPTRTIPPGASPDLNELGIVEWRNAYRSGDYVGRSLWLDEWYSRTDGGGDSGGYPAPIYIAKQGRVAEMCIGMGAHTHYWDKTAPDVAQQIDDLIRGVLSKR